MEVSSNFPSSPDKGVKNNSSRGLARVSLSLSFFFSLHFSKTRILVRLAVFPSVRLCIYSSSIIIYIFIFCFTLICKSSWDDHQRVSLLMGLMNKLKEKKNRKKKNCIKLYKIELQGKPLFFLRKNTLHERPVAVFSNLKNSILMGEGKKKIQAIKTALNWSS